MSQTIAESVLVCECGKSALVPRFLSSGGVCVCAECARAFRLSLIPIAWSEVERVLEHSEKALSDFDWLRARVPHARRRTLPEPAARRRSASTLTAWTGFALALVLLALIVGKVVAS